MRQVHPAFSELSHGQAFEKELVTIVAITFSSMDQILDRGMGRMMTDLISDISELIYESNVFILALRTSDSIYAVSNLHHDAELIISTTIGIGSRSFE
jgi:hypothetical protein